MKRGCVAAPPGEVRVGQEGATAFETYVSALNGCKLTSTALYRAQGSPPTPNGTPASTSQLFLKDKELTSC